MTNKTIPFHFFRGGTSRALFFHANDLPQDRNALSELLMTIMGAGHPRNIDGFGGGNATTTKVAVLSPSPDNDADVDYLFAQVAVDERMVDYGPTCGNILVAVGPASIEMGIIKPVGDKTAVKIRAVNTGAMIESIVETPGGKVSYTGDAVVDGVPGTSAPISLNFLSVVGTKCGAMLPTGKRIETINGIEVTCMDVAMPMMIARASDFGITGYESVDDLNANRALFEKIEAMRIEAGKRMGLGDVTKSVMPKIGLLSKAENGGHFSARYFMPWHCHPTLAITGSQCLTACALLPGTVADGLTNPMPPSPANVKVEHPSGIMEVAINYKLENDELDFISAGVVRTARFIARGEAML